MKNITNLFALVLACIFLNGCSKAEPSEAIAKDVTLAHFNTDECIKINNFKKTNGQAQDVFGVKTYQMDTAFEVEFIKTCFARIRGENFGYVRATEMILTEKFSTGKKFQIKGRINFQMKENGWEGNVQY